MRSTRILAFALVGLAMIAGARAQGQAALLMEEPYGFFGALNPTGHNAIYFERLCAETPVHLRPCGPGEMGAVIARYQGIQGYDWVAIPLIPYLYSVENAAQVPDHVNREMVDRFRDRYREAHLMTLGSDLREGSIIHGGWTQLIGVAYERRIYAFRFETTATQDYALMDRLNAGPNRSNFDLLFSNCADFAREILNSYFPKTFRRNIFPDAGMTTPKQIAYKLVKYGHKHPETKLAIFQIPQVPGYRRLSRPNKGIDESFVTTVYAIPITIMNPYVAGGLFVDYLFHGRHRLVPKHPEVLGPETLTALTQTGGAEQNPPIADIQSSSTPAATEVSSETPSGLKETEAMQ